MSNQQLIEAKALLFAACKLEKAQIEMELHELLNTITEQEQIRDILKEFIAFMIYKDYDYVEICNIDDEIIGKYINYLNLKN